jgi:bifunctional non-homologous end joining protein LigD
MAGLPHLIRPMLASLRHGLPEDEASYGWELKWDGLRAIAYVSGGTVRLVSRNDKEMAASYPELAVLADRVGSPVILDGEIVALREGRPDFGLLQSRMHVQQPDDKLIRSAPVQMYVFDLLYQGHDSLLAPGGAGEARPERRPGPYPAVAPRRGGRRAGRQHRQGPGRGRWQAADLPLPP